MTRLDGQNRAGCRQVGCTHNVCCGAQVRAHAHAFKNGGGFDEALHIGDAEVVTAGRYWGCAGLGESSCQETDVGGLVRGDFFQVGVESRVEAGRGEHFFGEVGETFPVECVFEMLQGKSIVEDVGVGDGRGGLTDLFQKGCSTIASEYGLRRGTARVRRLTVEQQGWQQRKQRRLQSGMCPSYFLNN